jgi:hypothetical protein
MARMRVFGSAMSFGTKNIGTFHLNEENVMWFIPLLYNYFSLVLCIIKTVSRAVTFSLLSHVKSFVSLFHELDPFPSESSGKHYFFLLDIAIFTLVDESESATVISTISTS